ncbi:MAG: HAD family hydrolase [Desulfobacteraceae bacterium]|nr:HAD family hydrolase [Desulfobacteraceae bacterium]
MINTILLDLDNTMVLFDETAFYLRFMEHITPYFGDLVPAAEFGDRLLIGIRELRNNDGSLSNREYFLNHFCRGIDNQRHAIWQRFLSFYQSEYEKIPVQAARPDGLEELLDQLEAWGLRIVVATNPIFHEIAPNKRMAWVGIDPRRFLLTTHIDNMGFVKPRREYYQQLCGLLGTPPEQCLMVGNDLINDMVAGTAGIKTFLSTESGIIDYTALTKGRSLRGGEKHAPDFSGPLAAVLTVVAGLNRR